MTKMMLYGGLAAPPAAGDCAQAFGAAHVRTTVPNVTAQTAKYDLIDRNLMRDTPIGVSLLRSECATVVPSQRAIANIKGQGDYESRECAECRRRGHRKGCAARATPVNFRCRRNDPRLYALHARCRVTSG